MVGRSAGKIGNTFDRLSQTHKRIYRVMASSGGGVVHPGVASDVSLSY
jgi:phosphopantetheine adenylyltransferase